MKLENQSTKLFHLLVMGGVVLAGGTRAMSQADTQTEEALKPAFCAPFDASRSIDENVCSPDDEGIDVVKEGFYCCWGTSCAEK